MGGAEKRSWQPIQNKQPLYGETGAVSGTENISLGAPKRAHRVKLTP